MYLEAAVKIYADRHKQQFEFLAAWKKLKDKPKCTSKITSDSTARAKRKAGGEGDVTRPCGRKAAKAVHQKSSSGQSTGDEAHLRFVVATEKKTEVMEQQLHLTIVMQDPQSDESKEFFSIQRKAILAQLKTKQANATSQQSADKEQLSHRQSPAAAGASMSDADKENSAPASNSNNNNNNIPAFPTALV